MKDYSDDIGKRFSRLIVMSKAKSGRNKTKRLLCKCDCGKTKIIYQSSLRNGNTKSCGCLSLEVRKKTMTKHNQYGSRLNRIWRDMNHRCHSSSSKSYKNYGGRGITVCNSWKNNFMSFYNWAIFNGYQDNLMIERINNDGNYCPENCTWKTHSEQQWNKQNTVYININNKKYNLLDLSKLSGLELKILRKRYYGLGWRGDKLIKPLRERVDAPI